MRIEPISNFVQPQNWQSKRMEILCSLSLSLCVCTISYNAVEQWNNSEQEEQHEQKKMKRIQMAQIKLHIKWGWRQAHVGQTARLNANP